MGVLSESDNSRKYWSVLKTRLKAEGSQLAENCSQLKMKAEDGKMRLADVAGTEEILRPIQSIPSPKAEPFKMWLAKVEFILSDSKYRTIIWEKNEKCAKMKNH